jgi:hypothetical protein
VRQEKKRRKKMSKEIKTYYLSPINAEWLERLAALESLSSGSRVSASELLDQLLAEKRSSHEISEKQLEKFVEQLRKAKVTA